MSPLEVMFNSGMGLLVTESRGALNVQMSVPPFYNETYPVHMIYAMKQFLNKFTGYIYLCLQYYTTNQSGHRAALPPPLKVGVGNCASFVWTQGLFGPWNNDVNDDFTTPDCNAIKAGNYPPSENESRNIYYEFGEKCKSVISISVYSLSHTVVNKMFLQGELMVYVIHYYFKRNTDQFIIHFYSPVLITFPSSIRGEIIPTTLFGENLRPFLMMKLR